jgi:hypothetical protein
MDAGILLEMLRSRGVTLARSGNSIDVHHNGELTDADRELIRTHKAALLPLLPESSAAQPPVPADRSCPAVAGPPLPAEWHGAPLDGHWHSALAWWPVEWRQKWGDRAEVHQAAGIAWDVAEYWAWRETLRELDAFEAAGGVVEYQEPAPRLSDRDALAQIDRLTWGAAIPAQTEVARTAWGPRDFRQGDAWLPWHGKSEDQHPSHDGGPERHGHSPK